MPGGYHSALPGKRRRSSGGGPCDARPFGSSGRWRSTRDLVRRVRLTNSCKRVEANAREAIVIAGVEAEVRHVTDYREIAAHGILRPRA